MQLSQIFKQYRWKFIFTFFLVLVEAGLNLLFPLVIGHAIDSALANQFWGVALLGGFGLLSLMIGVGRRFFDTRFYARVFQNLGMRVNNNINQSTSQRTARMQMLNQIVSFFENSMPSLINSVIGLVGTLVIVATMNITVFWLCFGVAVPVVIIYALTSNKTISFNKSYNDELEQQVDIIKDNNQNQVQNHLKQLMFWNIRMSDLEMSNFFFVWIIMMVFLVYAITLIVEGGVTQHGAVFSLVMYLFQYISSMVAMPSYYQQWLRLQEITSRLREI